MTGRTASARRAHGGRPVGRPPSFRALLAVAAAPVALSAQTPPAAPPVPAVAPAPAPAPAAAPPLHFGLAFGTGTPLGEFGRNVETARGFSSWVSVPLTRTAKFGIRGEFSVLTFPEQSLAVTFEESGAEAVATLRSTVGFTGLGPRLETRLGPATLTGAAMAGLARLIVDVGAQASLGEQLVSATQSLSENRPALKLVGDVLIPLYHGRSSAAIGITGGVDWLVSGAMEYPRRQSLTVTEEREIVIGTARSAIRLAGVRVGVGVVF